jgi:hypothetical protein
MFDMWSERERGIELMRYQVSKMRAKISLPHHRLIDSMLYLLLPRFQIHPLVDFRLHCLLPRFQKENHGQKPAHFRVECAGVAEISE